MKIIIFISMCLLLIGCKALDHGGLSSINERIIETCYRNHVYAFVLGARSAALSPVFDSDSKPMKCTDPEYQIYKR